MARVRRVPSTPVAVVVLNYRAAQETADCVLAVAAGKRLDLRVLVVDNAAPGPEHDELLAVLAAAGLDVGTGPDAGVRVVASGGNLGYAAGNNLGLRVAADWSPEFCWLLNPDIRVAPDTLDQLLAAMRAAPDAAAVGARVVLDGSDPLLIWSDGGSVDPATGQTRNLSMGRREDQVGPGGLREVDYVYGGCLLVRSSAASTVGPIPEDYFLYFEETDWCLRLAAAGWRLLTDTRARVLTLARPGGGLIAPHYLYYMARNRLVFANRHGYDERGGLSGFRRTFLRPWRERVAAADPSWLPTFDDLVSRAAHDAAAGRTGRAPWVESVPGPVAPPAQVAA